MPPTRYRTPLVALGLLILTNGPVFFVNRRILDGALGWEEPFTRQVFVATALVAVATVVLDRHRQNGERLFRPAPLAAAAIAFFAVWIVLSTFWSLAPDITRGRSAIYIGLPAMAWILADLDFSRLRAALGLAAGFAVGASLLVVVSTERIGLDKNDDWLGIYTNRNSLAPVAGLAIIVGLSLMAGFRSMAQNGLLMFLPLFLIDELRTGPLWMGVTMMAMQMGGLVAAPIAGICSDRVGQIGRASCRERV